VAINADDPLVAAKAASVAGDHATAMELYEKLWDFRSAYTEARAARS